MEYFKTGISPRAIAMSKLLIDIANEDLKLRGPGDFFGIRQSGEMQFALADIYQDAMILQQVAGEVTSLLEEDPELEMSKNVGLKQYLMSYLHDKHNILQL